MKVALFSFVIIIVNYTNAQSFVDGASLYINISTTNSYEIDSSYHTKMKGESWSFFDKDSNQIFQEFFDDYPFHLGASNFKMKNKKGNFIVNPKTKKIIQIDSKYKTRYDFNDISLAISTLSNDTLIKLKNDFINFKNEILVNGDLFTSHKNYKKDGVPYVKGYAIKDEIDLFFEDEGYFDQMDTSEYDDGIRDYLFIQKNKNSYLKNLVFDDVAMIDEELYHSTTQTFSDFTEHYFIAKKNGKYGVISTLGKTILPFEFSNINSIFQEHLMLFNHSILFKATRNNMDEIYDSKGHFLFASNYINEDEYMEFYGNFSYGYYEGLVTRNKNKVGIISLNGIEVIPTKYEYYDVLDFKLNEQIKAEKTNKSSSCNKYEYEQYFLGINESNQNYSYDFYAPNGQFLNHFDVDGFESFNNRGYICYYKGDFYGLIGPGARTVLDAKYQSISVFSGERDIFSVSTDSTSYFVDGKGEKLFKGEVSGTFVDGSYAVIYQNGGYGLMDVNKSIDTISWTIQPKYDNIEPLGLYQITNDPYFTIKKGDKFGLVNSFDKELLPIVYDQISISDNLILTVKNGKYGLQQFHSSRNHTVLPNEYDKILYLRSSLFKVQKGNKLALYHQYDKKFVCDFDYESIENIPSNNYSLLVKKNGKTGVMSEQGKIVVEPIYTSIKFDVVSNEYECLKENGQKDCFFVK